jgi:hypothetical protein
MKTSEDYIFKRLREGFGGFLFPKEGLNGAFSFKISGKPGLFFAGELAFLISPEKMLPSLELKC